MSASPLVATLTVIFVAAALLLVVATRYQWPVIPFYLLAGALVGLLIEEALLLDLAQWGVAFLVFAFAVEIEPLGSGGIREDAGLVTVVQIFVTGALLYSFGVWLGLNQLNALYFGIAGSLSSSLVALSLLERRIRLRTLHERMAESIHFMEDVVAVVGILFLSAFVYGDSDPTVLAVGAGLVAAGLFVRYVLFDRIATYAEGDVEILMLTGVTLIIGFIALSELTGVSIVVGAFAAGLAVSSDYPHDVEVLDSISYLEDFFMPIFFVTLGALVAIPTDDTILVTALLIVAVLVLKPLILYATLRWRGYDSRTALLTGYNLDQVSEFSLIIAIEALAEGAMAEGLFDAIVFAAIVTMFASTFTARHVERAYQYLVQVGLLEPDLDDIRARSNVEDGIEDHVVVSGYDREGQQIVEACEEIDHPYVVIESDPTREDLVRGQCDNYVFSDAMTESAWKVACAENAALIVATAPRREWAEQLLSFDLDADKIVHAVDVETGADLLERGAVFVAVPDVLVAERLRQHVRAVLEGEETPEELRAEGRRRLEMAREYGPSDVRRLR